MGLKESDSWAVLWGVFFNCRTFLKICLLSVLAVGRWANGLPDQFQMPGTMGP